ncbi:hypothetical protein HMPREF9099_02067 [Lachnospiraceae bacterium oral taxon 082 str. F0431]|nr:hypothetical protein HMPREF9099_02067 [Lachnospiraceae bacterium oral taxon 082 str. F0431]
MFNYSFFICFCQQNIFYISLLANFLTKYIFISTLFFKTKKA